MTKSMVHEPCDTCKGWGKTITILSYPRRFIVWCPDCGRGTPPNLGVNLPAGCVFALCIGHPRYDKVTNTTGGSSYDRQP